MKEKEWQYRQIRRDDESPSFPAVTGASSLLVIFTVLCLTVFALLSLNTVLAGHRLGERNREAVDNYYRAEEEAHTILAQLREGKKPKEPEIHESHLSGPPGIQYSWTCRISDTLKLEAFVWLRGDLSMKTFFINRWQMVSDMDWMPEPELPVWQELLP